MYFVSYGQLSKTQQHKNEQEKNERLADRHLRKKCPHLWAAMTGSSASAEAGVPDSVDAHSEQRRGLYTDHP